MAAGRSDSARLECLVRYAAGPHVTLPGHTLSCWATRYVTLLGSHVTLLGSHVTLLGHTLRCRAHTLRCRATRYAAGPHVTLRSWATRYAAGPHVTLCWATRYATLLGHTLRCWATRYAAGPHVTLRCWAHTLRYAAGHHTLQLLAPHVTLNGPCTFDAAVAYTYTVYAKLGSHCGTQ